MNFFIYTHSYDENSGGNVVLHRLCHLINSLECHNAWLVKFDPSTCGKPSLRKKLSKIKWLLHSKAKFKVKEGWNTPVWNKNSFPADSVAIYPEVVNGNPLGINNVVRWLLHQPGFHYDMIDYAEGELYFKFNSAIDDFHYPGSKLSANELKVIYYPIDIYYDRKAKRDIEYCYLVRKGKDKPVVHNNDAVPIDGLSHSETADIFARSKNFICYDDYTAYSIFAVLAGCASFVVPGDGRTISDWYPKEEDRFGIAYGFSEEQRLWAENTKAKVYEHVVKEHERSLKNVQICIEEISEFFSSSRQ